MTLLSVDDLFAAPSADQIRASMVANLITLGVPADKWVKGGVASTILTVCSMALAVFASLIVTLTRGFFLTTSTGNSLKLLAKYMYGVTLNTGTYASGNVTLTNAGGGSFTQEVGTFTCQNSTTKATYTNTSAFTLTAGTTLSVPVTATIVGGAGNANPGAIDTCITALPGVTVTNPSSLVGVDPPSDAAIRSLCLARLGALSVRGVRTAYAYAIQTATNITTGAPVNINRWSISAASHTGTVSVYVAAPSGVPLADDVAGVAANVEAVARPEAVTVTVSAATAVPYAPSVITYVLLPDGVTSAAAKTAIDTALTTMIAAYPVGGEPALDDTHLVTPVNGLFASGVYGNIAATVASLGGRMISALGATDLILTAGQVATNYIVTTVRVITPSTGTTVV